MKQTISLLVFTFISIVSSFSQSNFKEGFVITNQNDTLKGLIDFRTGSINAEICRFKPSENDPEKIYYPGEIEAYRLINEGKYYISRTVIIDSIPQKKFLEFLVQGMLNLYYLSGESEYYFFEDKDGSLIALTKKNDEVIDNKLREDNKYKKIMSYVFRDCLPLAMETSNANFGRKSMIKYAEKYHNKMCESGNSCIIFENDYKKKFTKFNLTVYSGFELIYMELNRVYSPKMLLFSPIIGTEFEMSTPRLIKPVSLIISANFTKLSGKYSYDLEETHFRYNYSGFKTNLGGGIKYTYSKGIIRPSAEIDYIFSYLFDSKSDMSFGSSIDRNSLLPQNSIKSLEGGIGIDYLTKKNHFLVVKLLYCSSLIPSDIKTDFQLKLGYKF